MNQEKAREFFSAYHDGSLEPGLRQTLEQRLRVDAQLQSEYRSFERTMEELEHLRYEEIEVPTYLSDRIATRIEEAHLRRRPTSIFSAWLPRLAFIAVAGAAIFGAVSQLKPRGNDPLALSSAQGSAFSIGSPSQYVHRIDDQTKLVFVAPADGRLAVEDATGREIKAVDLRKGQRLESQLVNPNPTATLLKAVYNHQSLLFAAVPGNTVDAATSGSGDLKALAIAAAGHYRRPILIGAIPTDITVTWTFSSTDPMDAIRRPLEGTGYDVIETPDKLLTIVRS